MLKLLKKTILIFKKTSKFGSDEIKIHAFQKNMRIHDKTCKTDKTPSFEDYKKFLKEFLRKADY